jgi:hypothetical protein
MEILEGLLAVVVGLAKLVEFVVSPMCYCPGWLVSKAVTLGAYPPSDGDGAGVEVCLMVGVWFWGVVIAAAAFAA